MPAKLAVGRQDAAPLFFKPRFGSSLEQITVYQGCVKPGVKPRYFLRPSVGQAEGTKK
jgi:hypothetical protein